MTKCFGIAGWKNSGKTSLVASLVSEITGRGLKVSTIKHAHHTFDIDREGTDSYKHRDAGAQEVVLVSRNRWALQHELRDEEEPSLEYFLDKLSDCDVVIVEGYKREKIPKIEVIGPDNLDKEQFWKDDQYIKAVSCDQAIEGSTLPKFSRNDIKEMADFILEYHQIGK